MVCQIWDGEGFEYRFGGAHRADALKFRLREGLLHPLIIHKEANKPLGELTSLEVHTIHIGSTTIGCTQKKTFTLWVETGVLYL